MKKVISIFVLIAIVLTSILLVFADSKSITAVYKSIQIMIDKRTVDTANDTPFIYNGRVYVPARYVAEGLGATVDWDEKNNTVQIKKEKPQVTRRLFGSYYIDAINWQGDMQEIKDKKLVIRNTVTSKNNLEYVVYDNNTPGEHGCEIEIYVGEIYFIDDYIRECKQEVADVIKSKYYDSTTQEEIKEAIDFFFIDRFVGPKGSVFDCKEFKLSNGKVIRVDAGSHRSKLTINSESQPIVIPPSTGW